MKLPITLLLVAIVAGGCTSSSDAGQTSTVPTAAPTTAAPTTAAPTSTAAVAATSASVPSSTSAPTPSSVSVTGEPLFELGDDDLHFTISTDASRGTATFSVEGPATRWVSEVPWIDVPNVSGHRPFDGLDAVDSTLTAEQVEANRALVTEYIQTALVEGRWEDVDRFFLDGQYILHSPLFADGLESIRSFFIGLRDAGNPFTIGSTALLMADGNHVLAINRHDSGGVTTAYWDLWRLEQGAIVEHWDAVADVPAADADAWFAGTAG